MVIFGKITAPAKEEFLNRCEAHRLSPQPEIWDLERLNELWVMRNTVGDLSGTSIEIPIDDNKFFSIAAPESNMGIGNSFVANVNSLEFIRAISNYFPQIFALNVRQYLGSSNKINKRITATIKNTTERHHFWHYNNGITIIADNVQIFNLDSNPIHFRITNPQIVNGAQTIYTMYKNMSYLTEQIKILARIIVVENSDEGKVKKLAIAQFTNSQSPVNTFDMRSNDRVQLYIQAHFRALDPMWFYERKRGEWGNLARAEQRRYGNRKISMIELSQFWYSFSGHPAEAISNKEELFSNLEIYVDIFKEDRDVRLYLLSKYLFDTFNDYLSSEQFEYLNSISGLSQEQLNKLLIAQKLSIAYSVALSKILLERRYGAISGRDAEILIRYLSDDQNNFRRNLLAIIFSVMGEYAQNIAADVDIRRELRRDGTLSSLNTTLNREIARRIPYASLEVMFSNLR